MKSKRRIFTELQFSDIAYFVYARILLLFFRTFPIDKNKILIVNYAGKGFGDNGRRIVEAISEEHRQTKIYWSVRKKFYNSIPKELHAVIYSSIKYFFHLATAKIIINNARFPIGIIKRRKQFYIQTWHGDIGFKKIEADAEKALPKKYINGAKNDAKMTDLMISGSAFFTNLCHTSFWYKGEVLECGCPRNDIFFDKVACDEIYGKIRNHYNFKKSEKILLYAPTFRKDKTLKYYNIDFEKTLKSLKEKFSGDWKILVRLHPNISDKSQKMKIWNESVINATSYPDAQELLIASDIVITDYSSIVFDFALLGRPAFLFAPDYELYDKDRGFYLDYFNLPFPVAENAKQLQENILNFSERKYKTKLSNFLTEGVGTKETGKASKIIAKRIIKELNEN